MEELVCYDTHTAQGFESIYDLGQEAGEETTRRSIVGGTYTYRRVEDHEGEGLAVAARFLAEQQASVPNYTDDDARFCTAFAAGYIVAVNNEQDCYEADPEGRLGELVALGYGTLLPEARIVDAASSGEE